MRTLIPLAMAPFIVLAAPPFAEVQRDLMTEPGSWSNAWADYDNDGDLDYAVTTERGDIRLYRNDGGTLVSVGAALGLPVNGVVYRGISWGDPDGDGWLDLFAGAADPTYPSALYHNFGGHRFANVAAETNLAMPGHTSRQANWIDFDNDGDVDLYATDRFGANRLHRNDGGTFTPVFVGVGPTGARSTVGACWLDYDKDGDLDLFLANQSGETDALWRNDGDRFIDVAPALGMDRPRRPGDEGSAGCAVGDYDRDGNLDIFVASYGTNVLWRNKGDGTFEDRGNATGVAIANHAVGAAFGDWDNDGYPDLAVTSHEGPMGWQTPHDSLFHNLGGKAFVNVLRKGDLLNAGDHGVAWADYDRDGALDLSVTRGYSPEGGHFVFRNLLPRVRAVKSLNVLVLDAKGHFTQAGAEVRLYAPGGKLIGSDQVSTGGGYSSQGATPVHFGVPDSDKVTVEVTFMGAKGREVLRIPNVSIATYAGRSLVVRRPS